MCLFYDIDLCGEEIEGLLYPFQKITLYFQI